MKPALIGLVFLSSFAFAKNLEVFVGGQYTCDFERTPRFVKAKGPFNMEVSQEGLRSTTRVLKLINTEYSLEAKNYDGSSFQEIVSNFPVLNDMPVAKVDTQSENNENPTELGIGLVFQTEPHTYQGDSLKCMGEPVMKKVPVLQFDCDTTDYVGEKEIPVKLRFALANLADPNRMMVLKYSGQESEEFTPIRVVPRSSYFTSLNENLSGDVHRDYVIINGDSDGVYSSHLRLNRPGLTQGVAWLEGDDEISQTRRLVNCMVVGDVDHAFDDHRR